MSCEDIPKNKRVLTRFAIHPGTKKQPYLKPAWLVVRIKTTTALSQALVQATVVSPVKLVRLLDREMKKLAFELQVRAKKLAPKDTRTLSKSINVRKEGPMNYLVGTNVEYARAVEEGTKPHIILPKTKQVLCFKGKSRAKKRRKKGKGRGRRSSRPTR